MGSVASKHLRIFIATENADEYCYELKAWFFLCLLILEEGRIPRSYIYVSLSLDSLRITSNAYMKQSLNIRLLLISNEYNTVLLYFFQYWAMEKYS